MAYQVSPGGAQLVQGIPVEQHPDQREPAFEEEECIACCAGKMPQTCYNFMVHGPYFKIMEEERVWEKDEVHVRKAPSRTNSMAGRVSRDPEYGAGIATAPSIEPASRRTSYGMDVDEDQVARQRFSEVRDQIIKLRKKNIIGHKEMLPLPFDPPRFYLYLSELLFGTAIVGQYIITTLIALMVAQAELDKFPDDISSAMPQLIKAILVLYPLSTMMLLLVASMEMSIRKFLYYRLMSIGVLVDWDNAGILKLAWFNWYFLVSFVIMNIWTLYAAVVSNKDKSSNAVSAWAIVNIQTLLLYNYYRNRIELAERYLVTMNEFVENAPFGAKAFIESCDVIRESDLASAIVQLCRSLWNPLIDCRALVLDIAKLRHTRRVAFGRRARRDSDDQYVMSEQGPALEQPGMFSWLRDLVESILIRRLYASFFVFLMSGKRLLRVRGLKVWPYRGDNVYFFALWVTSLVCFTAVLMVEGYALYLAFRRDDTYRNYGSPTCRDCFSYLYKSGKSCRKSGVCTGLEPANTTFCLSGYLLESQYNRTAGFLSQLATTVCPGIQGELVKDLLS